MKPIPMLAALAAATAAVIWGGSVLGLPAGAQGALVLALFGAAALALGAGAAAPAAPAAAPGIDSLPAGVGRALLNRMPAPLVVISEERRLTYANPAAQQLLPKVAPGTHYSALIRAPAFVEAIEALIEKRGERAFTFSLVGQQERVFEARASYLPAGAIPEFGQTAQIVVLIEDRTRDKALLQMRSDFIANASHELRTPLASILGYIETLQGHAREDAAARETFLGIMRAQATRMQRLVDDLLSLSRIEMNAHVRPVDPVDFYAVAADAAAALFPLASQSDVLLQIELPQGPGNPPVLGDRDQLAQVVANLVDNAIKYSGAGQMVRVLVAEPDGRHPGNLGVAVIDEGPGIAREHIPRLTERFYRVDTARSKKLGGTGLGLAITKHILQRHGGALDIRSRPGEGSRFTAWVPAAPPETPQTRRALPGDSEKTASDQKVGSS